MLSTMYNVDARRNSKGRTIRLFTAFFSWLDGEIFSVFKNGLKPWFIEIKILEIFYKKSTKMSNNVHQGVLYD